MDPRKEFSVQILKKSCRVYVEVLPTRFARKRVNFSGSAAARRRTSSRARNEFVCRRPSAAATRPRTRKKACAPPTMITRRNRRLAAARHHVAPKRRRLSAFMNHSEFVSQRTTSMHTVGAARKHRAILHSSFFLSFFLCLSALLRSPARCENPPAF